MTCGQTDGRKTPARFQNQHGKAHLDPVHRVRPPLPPKHRKRAGARLAPVPRELGRVLVLLRERRDERPVAGQRHLLEPRVLQRHLRRQALPRVERQQAVQEVEPVVLPVGGAGGGEQGAQAIGEETEKGRAAAGVAGSGAWRGAGRALARAPTAPAGPSRAPRGAGAGGTCSGGRCTAPASTSPEEAEQGAGMGDRLRSVYGGRPLRLAARAALSSPLR